MRDLLQTLDWWLAAFWILQAAVGWSAGRSLRKRGERWLRLDDRFLAADKLEHLSWSFVAWVLLAVLGFEGLRQVVWFAAVAVGVEVLELARYATWTGKGKPLPWPWMVDRVSWRDLVVDVAGAIGAALALGALR